MNPLHAENKVLQTKEVTVIFEERQVGAAKEVAKVYPSVKSELAVIMKIPCGLAAGYLNVRNCSLSYSLANPRSKLRGMRSLSVSKNKLV